ncbi:hypothetical protein ACFQVD_42285 [Streptosporangium amethystogenes subsp. fukuiense]|uniref:TetR family transcriptional regulator n=1 Tax=Streptosporangium amethystogenes subsp. fukuiense TaxID=698418 RepID=A0ABW2TDK0_9ACTN
MNKLRSDTERTVRTILEAAERVLSRNPAASMEQIAEATEVARVYAVARERCDEMFRRARDAGLLRADADLDWTRRVYYALIHEAATGPDEGQDADALATRLVDTLLHGFGEHNR